MSAFTYLHVLVQRDANTHIPRVVSQWELPVLESVWPEGTVVVGEEFVREMEAPEPDVERARLERVYGRDEETKVAHVESVYGAGSNSVRGLKKAIESATVKKSKDSADGAK